MSGLLLSIALGMAMAQGQGANAKPPAPPIRTPPMVAVPSPPALSIAPPRAPPAPPPSSWFIPGGPRPLRRGSWFTTDDYPAAAMRNEEEGTVVVRLDVTAAGRVGGCTILSSSGSSSLDAATCRIFRARARFEPARARHAEAVASTHVDRVRWQLPDTTSLPFEPAIATVGAVLAGERMVACEPLDAPVRADEPDDDEATLATEACGIVFPRRQPAPAAIGQGRSRVRVTIEVERDGRPRATAPVRPGRPIFAATATFQVAADGRPADCRARVTVRPRDRRLPSLDLCALLQRQTLYLFEEAATDERTDRGRLTITVLEGEAAR